MEILSQYLQKQDIGLGYSVTVSLFRSLNGKLGSRATIRPPEHAQSEESVFDAVSITTP